MEKKKKRERSREKEKSEEKRKNTKKNTNSNINLNHHWKKYYDSKYKQIFYNNPFTGESVWELPKGAKVEESNEPIEIIQSNESNKNKEKENSEEEESITEENNDANNIAKNSYKEIEAIEEGELKEKIRYRKMKEMKLREWSHTQKDIMIIIYGTINIYQIEPRTKKKSLRNINAILY